MRLWTGPRLPKLLLAITLGLAALPISAQSTLQLPAHGGLQVDLGNSAVALTDWKFHPGDDPAWALPGYTDSGWTTMDMRGDGNSHDPYFSSELYVPGWTARGFPTLTGYAWYRTRFHLIGDKTDLWLEMPPNFDDGYQLYVSGKLVGEFGNFTAHHTRMFYSRSTMFHLPPLSAHSDVVLALRFFMDPDTPQWNVLAGGLHSAPVVGLAPIIALMQSRNSNVNLHTFLSYLLLAIVLAVAGIAALWIYLIDRKEHAYLWLTLALLTGAAAALIEFLGSVTFRFSNSPELLARDVGSSVLVPLFWLFFWAHWFRLHHRRMVVRAGWILGLLELCVFACMRQYLFGSYFPVAWGHPLVVASVVLRAAFALLFLAVTVGGIRQNRAEGWIAVTAIVPLCIGLFSIDLQFVAIPVEYFPLGIHVGIDIVAWFVLAIIVIALVLRRFLRTQVRQQEMAQEMHQAQEMQRILVPQVPGHTPGFELDAVYLPASEVGGDFFQVQPGNDGSLLVIVGDVSGKGLKAAMTVSTIVGALRGCSIRGPADVLAYLNRVLYGQVSGFVTCSAAVIAADGKMTIANAGHLSPYCNGEELAVAGGLPLGLVAEGSYEETRYQLALGDRLIFMSDGVVEARNTKGELYGFERTRRISKQSAAAIADTAKQFGQEDDISVLSVTRTVNLKAAVA
jgi:hypothetical protein